jgi:Zn ribbon nucleic-acid-binding protein
MSSSSISNNDYNTEMWKSKLGTNYPMEFMKTNENSLNKQLQSLRDIPANRDCADCGAKGCTMWASVNLGVFLCITCGSHHRSLGTHISKPKGCTGTYWWGPDELENMKAIGNARAAEIYGNEIPAGLTPTSNPMRWREYITNKYQHKKYAPSTSSSAVQTSRRSLELNVHPVESQENSITAANNHHHDLLSFEHAGEDFFSNFGTPKSSPSSTIRKPIKTNDDVDLLGLQHDDLVKKSSPPTSPTRKNMLDLSNSNFFAEFGL